MRPLRVVGSALVRTAVIVAFLVVYQLVLSNRSSTDALGAGLLFFLLVVLLALGWAAYDAARRGLATAALLWLVTSVMSALGLSLAFVLTVSDAQGLGAELADGGLFFGLLILLPALLGAVAGAVVRRLRGAGAA